LSKSEKTVRNQVTNIFAKLGVTSRAQAVAVARDAGLGDAK
jgi:DNA-binding NarL/FixJ family response regulator